MTDLGLYNRRGRAIATRPLHITSFIGVWNLSPTVCLGLFLLGLWSSLHSYTLLGSSLLSSGLLLDLYLSLWLLDVYKLNGEDESFIRFDVAAGTSLAISKVVRDVDFPLAAYRHQLQSLCPALDHLVQTERGSLWVALVAAVKHLSVDALALVFHGHAVCSLWLLALAFSDDLILPSVGQRHHTLLLCVLGEEILTLLLCSLLHTLLVCLLSLSHVSLCHRV